MCPHARWRGQALGLSNEQRTAIEEAIAGAHLVPREGGFGPELSMKLSDEANEGILDFGTPAGGAMVVQETPGH